MPAPAGVMDKPPIVAGVAGYSLSARISPKKKPRRAKPTGVDGGQIALAVGFGGGSWMSLQPGSNRLLPLGASGRLHRFAGYAGREDRQTKVTLESLAHQAFTHVVTWGFPFCWESCRHEDRHSRAPRHKTDQRYLIPDHRQDLSQTEADASKL